MVDHPQGSIPRLVILREIGRFEVDARAETGARWWSSLSGRNRGRQGCWRNRKHSTQRDLEMLIAVRRVEREERSPWEMKPWREKKRTVFSNSESVISLQKSGSVYFGFCCCYFTATRCRSLVQYVTCIYTEISPDTPDIKVLSINHGVSTPYLSIRSISQGIGWSWKSHLSRSTSWSSYERNSIYFLGLLSPGSKDPHTPYKAKGNQKEITLQSWNKPSPFHGTFSGCGSLSRGSEKEAKV